MRETTVTKDVFKEYFRSLIEKTASGEIKDTDIIVEISSFLKKNYGNMTPDMKALTDKIIDTSVEIFDQAIKTSPDTKETRAIKKLLRTMKRSLPSAQSLIMDMEGKSEIADPVIKETRVFFEKYFQVFLDALYDISIEQTQSGTTSYAILSILFSFVDELIAGFHMAQHAYINQAYTHIRSVLEGLNMIQLFLKDSSFADLWVSNEEKRKRNELSPWAVRKKLGIKEDPIYRFLSTYGPHPTFDYVKSKSARKASLSSNGNSEIHFFLGGTRLIRHIREANFNCILALQLALSIVGKAFPDRLHLEDYTETLKNAASDWKNYLLQHIQFYKDTELDVNDFELLLQMFGHLIH